MPTSKRRVRPGYHPTTLPAPTYVDDAAQAHAEQLERDWQQRRDVAQTQPVKREKLV